MWAELRTQPAPSFVDASLGTVINAREVRGYPHPLVSKRDQQYWSSYHQRGCSGPSSQKGPLRRDSSHCDICNFPPAPLLTDLTQYGHALGLYRESLSCVGAEEVMPLGTVPGTWLWCNPISSTEKTFDSGSTKLVPFLIFQFACVYRVVDCHLYGYHVIASCACVLIVW